MGVSQGKRKLAAGRSASGKVSKILYRWRLAVAFLGLTAAWATKAAAQEERPQIMPGERKVASRKDLGPRALGLLRLTASGKASLVPIAILINGKFWDASAYKAAPVPMALESGTVYEVDQAGNSLGLFTVGDALQSRAANAPVPWLATGIWTPTGKDAPNAPLKAETVPVGIDTSDAPPRLTRDPSRLHLPPASTAPASAPSSPPASPSSPGPSSGDEPPRLIKPKEEAPASPAPGASTGSSTDNSPGSSSGSSAGSGGSSQSGSSQTAPGSTSAPSTAAKPADHAEESPKGPESDSGASEANRPRLRRGRPTGPLPDLEIPGYSKPGAAASKDTKTPATSAAPEPVQLIPAISDAGGPDAHSFTFTWLKDEEGEKRKQMADLAKQQLRAYLAAQVKATTAAKGTQHRSAEPKLPDPVFENDRMVTYDVWMTNQPLLIFSTDAHLPSTSAMQSGLEAGLEYSIVLVAYPDIYNNLHKLYVGVTDRYHLDITPRLELIDAVDADGDGRGELLFRKTSDAGTGWVIYRATADTLWKMYDSLNPE